MKSCCFQDALYAGRLHLQECFDKMCLQWAKSNKPEKQACVVSGWDATRGSGGQILFLPPSLWHAAQRGASWRSAYLLGFPTSSGNGPPPLRLCSCCVHSAAESRATPKRGEGRGTRRSEMIQWLGGSVKKSLVNIIDMFRLGCPLFKLCFNSHHTTCIAGLYLKVHAYNSQCAMVPNQTSFHSIGCHSVEWHPFKTRGWKDVVCASWNWHEYDTVGYWFETADPFRAAGRINSCFLRSTMWYKQTRPGLWINVFKLTTHFTSSMLPDQFQLLHWGASDSTSVFLRGPAFSLWHNSPETNTKCCTWNTAWNFFWFIRRSLRCVRFQKN